MHPRRLALQLAVWCQSIAQAFELKGAEATQRWNKIGQLLRARSGRDPNWRRRPSVLDQLRGWRRSPLARKGTNSGDVSHGNLKAAASVDAFCVRAHQSANTTMILSINASAPMVRPPRRREGICGFLPKHPKRYISGLETRDPLTKVSEGPLSANGCRVSTVTLYVDSGKRRRSTEPASPQRGCSLSRLRTVIERPGCAIEHPSWPTIIDSGTCFRPTLIAPEPRLGSWPLLVTSAVNTGRSPLPCLRQQPLSRGEELPTPHPGLDAPR